jgi:DNA repair exonuclease SbcCD ATPase subunit
MASTLEKFVEDAISHIESEIDKQLTTTKSRIENAANSSNIVADAEAFIAEATNLIKDLEALLKELATDFASMIQSVRSAFSVAKNDLELGARVVERAVTGIGESAIQISTSLPGVITAAAEDLKTAMTEIVDTLESAARTIVQDIENSPITGEIERAVSEAINNASQFEAELTSRINDAINDMAADISQALTDINRIAEDAISRIQTAAKDAQNAVDDAIASVHTELDHIGHEVGVVEARADAIIARINKNAPSFFDIVLPNFIFAATAIAAILIIKYVLVRR